MEVLGHSNASPYPYFAEQRAVSVPMLMLALGRNPK